MFSESKFKLGQVVITRNAESVVDDFDVMVGLQRHANGDWGQICDEDKQVNEDSLKNGNRLMSVYEDSNGRVFWIITEASRLVTTILLPEDY